MGKANLDPDFKGFLKSMTSAGVRYLLVGGYAVSFHGYRRYTKDLDVWIATDPENREKVSRVLQEWGGFRAATVDPNLFEEQGKVWHFGREPVRIDLLTGPSGVDFEVCWARRQEVDLDGVKVPIISLKDLRMNKRASGRAKDLADLAELPEQPLPPPARGRSKKRRK